MTTSSLTLHEICALAHEALLNAGANTEHADAVADVVTRAERDGSHSHGLFRIPGYVASLRSGKVKGDADPTLSKRSPVVLHCDGDLGYAPLAHRRSLTALANVSPTWVNYYISRLDSIGLFSSPNLENGNKLITKTAGLLIRRWMVV